MAHHFDHKTIRQLLLFAVVAENQSVRKAAAKLNLSVPSLLNQLNELEQNLNLKFLRRSPRGVSLTEEGKAALPSIERFITQAEQLYYSLNQMREDSCGILSVGANAEAMLFWVPDFKKQVKADFPKIEIFTKEVDSRDVEIEVSEGLISFGIGLFKDLDDKRLRLIPLRRERPIILLPKGHRLTANREIYLKDLRNEEFVFHRREVAPKYFDELVRICESKGGFTPRICHEVQSSSRQMAYVSCGQGIAMLGESFKDWIPKNIVARPIVDAPAEIQLSLVWNPLVHSSIRDLVLNKITSNK